MVTLSSDCAGLFWEFRKKFLKVEFRKSEEFAFRRSDSSFCARGLTNQRDITESHSVEEVAIRDSHQRGEGDLAFYDEVA